MRIIIACEYSGTVRDAFIKMGHDAISCDLLPTDSEGPHLIMDNDMHLKDTLYGQHWDMVIAHPPCTYLTNSGVRWLYDKDGSKNKDRWQNLYEASVFFKMILGCPAKKVCIENPIPHKYAELPKYSQIVHPYYFGHTTSKATCLWLKGLPLLQPTELLSKDKRTFEIHKVQSQTKRYS